MELHLNDILELKKDHPCGSRRWQGLRVGYMAMGIALLLAIVMLVSLVLPYLGL